MSCRIIRDIENDEACFYCSTTMVPFGHVGSIRDIELFEEWLGKDPRSYGSGLTDKWYEFLKLKEEA